MNSATEAITPPVMKESKDYKSAYFKAYGIDVFMWSYSLLVLYKVIYVKMILMERYPEFNWSQPLVALLIGTALATICFFLKGFSIGKRCMGLFVPSDHTPFYKKPYVLGSMGIFALTFVAGIEATQFSFFEFFSEQGLGGARRIFFSLLNPNFAIIEPAIVSAVETIYMAFIATIFAIPIAFLLSFLSARNLMTVNPIAFGIYNLTRFFMNITRAIEPLVWAIIFSVWVGIGPFAGMLALFLHSVASLAKLYSEQIENIDDGPIEAMTATGAHTVQVIWYGVVPQIVLPFLSFTIYRWDINVRMATVIGLVGGGGIGTLLMQYQGLAKWNEVGLLVMIIALIVWVMDYLSAKIREAIK